MRRRHAHDVSIPRRANFTFRAKSLLLRGAGYRAARTGLVALGAASGSCRLHRYDCSGNRRLSCGTTADGVMAVAHVAPCADPAARSANGRADGICFGIVPHGTGFDFNRIRIGHDTLAMFDRTAG